MEISIASVVAEKRGACTASCIPIPQSSTLSSTCRIATAIHAPPGAPTVITGAPSSNTIVGDIVENRRFPDGMRLGGMTPYFAAGHRNKRSFGVDLRNPDDAAMARAEADLAEYFVSLEQSWPGLAVVARRMARTSHVPFDDDVQQAIDDAAGDVGLTRMRQLSGAGHDAQEMATLCPTAMIFVPGEYDGISHNPREYSTPEACAHGVSVLATVARRLAT